MNAVKIIEVSINPNSGVVREDDEFLHFRPVIKTQQEAGKQGGKTKVFNEKETSYTLRNF